MANIQDHSFFRTTFLFTDSEELWEILLALRATEVAVTEPEIPIQRKGGAGGISTKPKKREWWITDLTPEAILQEDEEVLELISMFMEVVE